MTGSGKTGLCISLLEEAAIDNIPAIIIDPKGDLCNLLLTFPNLAPQDFAPWVEEGVDPAQTSNNSGKKVSRSGARTASASSACTTRLTFASTRPAATPACPSRFSNHLPRHPKRSGRTTNHSPNELTRPSRACSDSIGIDGRSGPQSRTHPDLKHSQSGVVQRKRSRHRRSDSKSSDRLR